MLLIRPKLSHIMKRELNEINLNYIIVQYKS